MRHALVLVGGIAIATLSAPASAEPPRRSCCERTSFTVLFPQDFSDSAPSLPQSQAVVQSVTASLSDSLGIAARPVFTSSNEVGATAGLPLRHRFAEAAGTLIVVADTGGAIVSSSSKDGPWPRECIAIEHSCGFQLAVRELVAQEYELAMVPSHPHLAFLAPRLEVDEAIEDTFMPEVVPHLVQIEGQMIDGEALISAQEKLIDATVQTTLAMQRVNEEIEAAKQRIQSMNARIAQLAAAMPDFHLQALASITASQNMPPHFTLAYAVERDFLVRDAYDGMLLDLRETERSWTRVGLLRPDPQHPEKTEAQTPWSQPEVVEALATLDAILSNPAEFAPDLAASLAANGIRSVRIISAARTPYNQASQSNPHAAPGLSSNHILGTAIDIQLNGTPYDVSGASPTAAQRAAYAALEAALERAGFVRELAFSVQRERPHFVLSKYSRRRHGAPNPSYDVQAHLELATRLLGRMRNAVRRERERLSQQNAAQRAANARTVERLARLEAQLAARRDELNRQLDLERRVRAQLERYEAESRRREELRRREEERRRREEQRRERGGWREPRERDRPRARDVDLGPGPRVDFSRMRL